MWDCKFEDVADGWIVIDGDLSLVTVFDIREDTVVNGEAELEGDGLADVDCVEELDGEIMLVMELIIVIVGKVLDEPLVKVVELATVDTDIDGEPLTEAELLNDWACVWDANGDIDAKGDNEGNGLFDNVEIVE